VGTWGKGETDDAVCVLEEMNWFDWNALGACDAKCVWKHASRDDQ